MEIDAAYLHFTSLVRSVHVELQVRLNTRETLHAKEEFEVMCTQHGVVPQSYITDEGTSFTSEKFVEHLSQFKQTVKV